MYKHDGNQSNLHKIDNDQKFESTLLTKNIKIFGKRTSIRLEPEMWTAFEDITTTEECTDNDLCSLIFMLKRPGTSMTAAIRVFIMLYFKSAATQEGHSKAGHGNFYNMVKRANMSPIDFDKLKNLEKRIDLASANEFLTTHASS